MRNKQAILIAVNKSRTLPLKFKDAGPKRASVIIANRQGPSLNNPSTYEPISSVWEGSDGELLEAMFNFYATIPPEPILDSTYNAGRFWKGSNGASSRWISTHSTSR